MPRILICAVAAVGLTAALGSVSLAEDAPATRPAFVLPDVAQPTTLPTTQPTTQPVSSADVSKWISKLGDDDFHVRTQASTELVKIGKQALAALHDATKDANPEVASRAQRAIDDIENAGKPKPVVAAANPNQLMPGGGQVVMVGGNGQVVIHLNMVVQAGGVAGAVVQQGARDTTVTKDGKTIYIHEDENGIEMTVIEKDKDGKDVSSTFKAKDAAELKKKNPDAFKLYDANKQTSVNIQVQQGN